MRSLSDSKTDSNRAATAAVFAGAGLPIELLRLSLPSLAAGEALVRVECCTICGSDLHTITGKRTEKTPAILGHEICGFIDEVGHPAPLDVDGRPLAHGDRVTWSTSVSCGRCDRCQKGLPQKCRSLLKYGHEPTSGDWPLSGGLSQFVHLREGSAIVRIPPQIPCEVICPVNCATATVFAACRVAGSLDGARVLIFGAGMLGLTAAAVCRAKGASTIAICDRDLGRLAKARDFGADGLIEWHPQSDEVRGRCRELTGQASFDVILELSGSPDAVDSACALVDIGATVVLVGSVMKSRPVALDPESIVRRWLTIRGVHNYTPVDLRAAVQFLFEHGTRFPFAALVERTFPLEEINAAVDFALRQGPVRIAVVP